MKAKGQQPQVAKTGTAGLGFVSGEVPERLNGPVCKTVKGATNTLAGSNPALSATLISPPAALTAGRALTSGSLQRQGCYAHCHFGRFPRTKATKMYRLDPERRAQAVSALVEGNSIRAVSRMTGIDRGTITNLVVALGDACAEYQDKALRNLPCKRIQCDEIWAFCYAKDKNVPATSPFRA